MQTTILPSPGYTYESCLAAAERIQWRVEDLIGGDKRLDFTKPFLPEALARVQPLRFLNEPEKLALNQIRANTYLYMFGLVEEFILPFVLDHTRTDLGGDDSRTRAMLQFASEEAKHIHLFKRFREEFTKGFPGAGCRLIGPPDAIGRHVLSHDPLAVALVILQIEWMTQAHWVECTKDDLQLDPVFKSLLRHHWMEEAQHAKLDTLMVESLAAFRTPDQVLAAFGDYLKIGLFLDSGLETQMTYEREALEAAIGRTLTQSETDEYVRVQRQANRWTFLGSGMTHPNVLATFSRLHPDFGPKLRGISPTFC